MPNVADTVQIRLRYARISQDPVINVFHCRFVNPLFLSLTTGGIRSHFQDFTDAMGPFMSSAIDRGAGVSCRLTDLRTTPHNNLDSVWILPNAGNNDRLPDNLAACVGLKTALNTRRGSGRSYFGPCTLSCLEPANGAISGALIAAIAGGYLGLVNGLAADATDLRVYSRADGVARNVVSIANGQVFDHVDRRKAPGL